MKKSKIILLSLSLLWLGANSHVYGEEKLLDCTEIHEHTEECYVSESVYPIIIPLVEGGPGIDW